MYFLCINFKVFCRSVPGNSVADHLVYYGVELMGDALTSCKIVMDPRLADYGTEDFEGNFIFSRDPLTPILRLNSQLQPEGNSM